MRVTPTLIPTFLPTFGPAKWDTYLIILPCRWKVLIGAEIGLFLLVVNLHSDESYLQSSFGP